MTNNIAKIRAALEMQHGAMLMAELIGGPVKATKPVVEAALAALAELEKAVADPLFILTTGEIDSDGEQDDWDIECESSRRLVSFCAAHPGSTVKLYAAPPAPVAAAPQFVAGEFTDEVAARVLTHFSNFPVRLTNAQNGHDMIAAVRSELGPALGLVEIREPTPEECKRISDIYHHVSFGGDLGARLGREMFNACRAVMWPKEGL